ncbi:MAG TPA: hypothetical protein VFL51_03445 [Pseudolabrys sp.]|nr:hypothetical protein [Pseudolabrys sp.]
MIRSSAVVIAFAVVLAACSDNKKSVLVQNIPPTKYKDEILQTFPQAVADPTNVRDAAITQPMLNQSGPVHVYYVCVRANSRDASHQYMGVKEYAGYFYDGHLGQFVEAPPGLCDKVAYQPFPELEKLCFGKKCS